MIELFICQAPGTQNAIHRTWHLRTVGGPNGTAAPEGASNDTKFDQIFLLMVQKSDQGVQIAIYINRVIVPLFTEF